MPGVGRQGRTKRLNRALRFLAVLLLVAAPGASANLGPFHPLGADQIADSVRLEKAARRLTLFRGNQVLKVYRVSLGSEPHGAKERQGDGRTPEGRYTVDSHKADSAFHRALHISYPNAADRGRARKLGVSAGGDIMIHGLPNDRAWIGWLQRFSDWTHGCIAVTDPEIEEIYNAVPDGTPIEIVP